MVKPGRWEKNLKDLKRWVLHRIAEGPKRWSDLWDKKRFVSQRHLSNCLKQLMNEGYIAKAVVSHKNIQYVLKEDAKGLEGLYKFESWIESLTNLLKEDQTAAALRQAFPEDELEPWITAILIKEAQISFKLVRTICSLPLEKQELFKDWSFKILQDFSLSFFTLCYKASPGVIDSAYKNVESNLEEVKERFPLNQEPISILSALERIESILVR